MKHLLKKSIAFVIAFTLMISISTTMHAESISFSDVPATYWGYSTIMRMTNTGMFKGTSEPVNGVGTFKPENVMTRAEFITAVLRAIYPEEAKLVQNNQGKWWTGYYNLALNKGLLYSSELNNGAMDIPMTRQEMAMVLVRALETTGEAPSKWVSINQIADYITIGDYYKDYVLKCFSMGLICGIDAYGTFAPEKSLTRAEAATVLCRLVFSNERVPVVFDNNAASGGSLTLDGGGAHINDNSGNNKPNSNNNNTNNDPNDDDVDDNNNNGNDNTDNETNNDANNNGNTNNGNNNNNNNGNQETPNEPEDERDEIYQGITLEEVLAMNDDERQAFIDWLGSEEAYKEWLDEHQEDPIVDDRLPWEKEGKQPEDYTLEEYLALSDEHKYAFAETFENEEAFKEWLDEKQEEPDIEEDDLLGGKTLEEFTIEDYAALDPVDAAAFQEMYFDSEEDFLAWLDSKVEMPDLD